MIKPLLLSLSICLPGIAAGVPAGAQQSSDKPALNTARAAQQVELPVVVRDKKGEIVPTLQKTDLTLTVDGKPQTIQSLTKGSDGPYRIGLLVDTTRGMSGGAEAERKGAGAFIDQMLGAEGKSEAFLIHFDTQVELLEDFTSSRDKLHDELDNMGVSSHRRDDREGPETTTNPNTSSRHHGDDQLYDAIYLAADELMKGKDGQKVLVVFSNGADHGSKETLNDAVDAADRAGLAVYTIFFKGQQERQSSYVEGPGNRGGGIGYPGGGPGYPGGYPGGNPGGGGGHKQPEPRSATGVDGRKIMQQIAQRTGGHAFEAKHTSDVEPIYKLIVDELHARYMLAFTPDKPDSEGNFHKVAVTAANKEWTVSAPEGYYAPEK